MPNPIHRASGFYVSAYQCGDKKCQYVQRVYSGDTGYPKLPFGSSLFRYFVLIIVGYDESAKDKEESHADETFFENVRVKMRINHIAMRTKDHKGEEHAQGSECFYHVFYL